MNKRSVCVGVGVIAVGAVLGSLAVGWWSGGHETIAEAAAARLPDDVPAFFRRASLVALPHTRVDQSGPAFAALAFGRPLLLSDAGGFPELAATGAAALVPPGDPGALNAELRRLLDDPERLRSMGAAAAAAAAGPYSWAAIGRRTLELYAAL